MMNILGSDDWKAGMPEQGQPLAASSEERGFFDRFDWCFSSRLRAGNLRPMRLRRLCSLALALLCLGSTCSRDAPRLLSPGSPEPPFDYVLYSDAHGHFLGEDSAALLVQRPTHRESVFADAQRGDARAQELFLELEDVFLLGGWHVAEHVTQPHCLLTPFLPSCRPDWSFLDKLLWGPQGDYPW